jgi:hypothetical protein
MNRVAQVALLLLAVAAAGSPCVAQAGEPSDGPPPPAAEYSAKAWRELTSQVGRFSVRVPATPKLGQKDIDTALGKLLTYFETAETSAGMYAVIYSDFPNYLESPDTAGRVLDGARDRVLSADAGRKLLVERESPVEGHPGREWLVADAQALFRAQTFLVKKRFYQVLYVAPLGVAFNNGRASASAADRTGFYEDNWKKFFGSFKLLPEDATPYGVVGAAQNLYAPGGVIPAEVRTPAGLR